MIFFQCPTLTTSLLNWPFSIRYSGWLKLSFEIFSTSSWEHIIPGLCLFEHIHPLILHLSGHKTLRSHSSRWRIPGDPALLEFRCREVFWTVFPLYVLGIMLRCASPLGLVKMQMLTPEAWDGAEVPHLYGAGLCGSCWCRCWSTARTHGSAECPAHAGRAERARPVPSAGLPVWGSQLRPLPRRDDSRSTDILPRPKSRCYLQPFKWTGLKGAGQFH